MFIYEEPTPCPTHHYAPQTQALRQHSLRKQETTGRRRSLAELAEDEDTENLNFTTEVYTYLKNAAPRRPRTNQGKTNPGPLIGRPQVCTSQTVVRQITEHAEVDRGQRTSARVDTCQEILSNGTGNPQPIQRGGGVVAAMPQRPTNPRRRGSILLAQRQNDVRKMSTEPCGSQAKSLLHQTMGRQPRRMTIYIPPDDTTSPTVHPRAISSRNDLVKHHERTKNPFSKSKHAVDQDARSRLPSRPARESLANIAPRRVPLHNVSKPMQETLFVSDKAGKGGGKENIPPDSSLEMYRSDKQENAVSTGKKDRSGPAGNQKETMLRYTHDKGRNAANSSRVAPSGKRSRRGAIHSLHEIEVAEGENEGSSSSELRRLITTDVPSHHASYAPPAISTLRVHQELEKSCTAKPAKEWHEQYPVLDDISRPELYEDDWLSHQEAAITQLANSLFETSEDGERRRVPSSDELRKRLLHIYQEPPFAILHREIQAALLYGALSVPKGITTNASRLQGDIGLRRAYLDLWLDAYEPAAIKAATEVVIGRQLSEASRLSDNLSDNRARPARRALETFLDIFLIRNEDAIRPGSSTGNIVSDHAVANLDVRPAAFMGQRTILRSLLLILLLDKAKYNGTIKTCLFLPSSPHKSSASMLNALVRLLLPSVGDIPRALGRINYSLQHIQSPLQEYSYKITNLAIDLRDGVRLTHLIELLLCSSASVASQSDDINVTMPTGEVLMASPDHEDLWILSHHLKFPSTGRIQKMYNVQLALNALSGATGICNVAKSLKAEDIVDGYREKTIGLLWALVSRWGLSTLVDWRELKKETDRLRSRSLAHENEVEAELVCPTGFDMHASLLLAWAGSIARLDGLDVDVAPGAFADGNIFERIVDEYAPYLPTSQKDVSGASLRQSSLEVKLRSLGCNHYFCKWLVVGRGFSRPF